MASELWFHIGLHKTASTWLQTYLFPNLAGLQIHVTRKPRAIHAAATTGGRHLISHEGLSGTLSDAKPHGLFRERLLQGLQLISEVRPRPRILIGFREQHDWINAAFAQKSKKRVVDAQAYLRTFSTEELRWDEVLALVEQSAESVFPFLYEEFATDPLSLIEDMCQFLDCEVPGNIGALLKARTNLSPRTELGQKVSRPFFQFSYALDRRGLRTKPLRDFGARLGARLDQFGALPPEINFDPETAAELGQDWVRLVRRVSARRSRQLDYAMV